MHPRNRYKKDYNFDVLAAANPNLKPFVKVSREKHTIDFSDAKAVIELNKAMLYCDYQLKHWSLPAGYLCPPIPGRLDYIHHLADLLFNTNNNRKPKAGSVKALDLGTGASLVYPILGNREYDWHFISSDIDPVSIKNCQAIIDGNRLENIETRQQDNAKNYFNNIIQKHELIDITLCNPPFHSSQQDADKGTSRKWQNLNKSATRSADEKLAKDSNNRQRSSAVKLNFGGQNAELFCDGGEVTFVRRMINESKYFQQQVLWFSCLISKKENLKPLKQTLKKAGVTISKTVTMAQGNKTSRFIAWTFKTPEQQRDWSKQRFS
ncbi:23S rRNA (adenine(1618)-N(6))-methyltransferase RlmF [Thalassotalea crassostreae]|uniref:23S rRNA (adenine(1618)-N(6))-methyltransferase RlmF n=1 Tax=Thalassotalea crassostreae TaxID=1763536 RepID=UPI0008382318|nr:23S rRNA (adenine(1618)-N(6))-methyltransferase RlmF [Thalassotalea crassostreae]